MSAARIRFADGRAASENELHCVALALGFWSWDHMRQVFAERDRERHAATVRRAG